MPPVTPCPYDGVPVADTPVFVSDDSDDVLPSPTGVTLPHGELGIRENWGTRGFTLSVVLLGRTLAADTTAQGACITSDEDTARVPDDLACALGQQGILQPRRDGALHPQFTSCTRMTASAAQPPAMHAIMMRKRRVTRSVSRFASCR